MVSTNGGSRPRWRRDGKEILLPQPGFQDDGCGGESHCDELRNRAPPRAVPDARRQRGFFIPTYDVTADGQRFLINTALEAEGPPPITVVMNWARPN